MLNEVSSSAVIFFRNTGNTTKHSSVDIGQNVKMNYHFFVILEFENKKLKTNFVVFDVLVAIFYVKCNPLFFSSLKVHRRFFKIYNFINY